MSAEAVDTVRQGLPQRGPAAETCFRFDGFPYIRAFRLETGIFTDLFNIQPLSNVFATVSKRCYKL
jgi:hypothetical protein